jgi:hypothetical protein
MSAKVSIKGQVVLSQDHNRAQFTVSMKVRGKDVSTFTITGENDGESFAALGRWFAVEFAEQLAVQSAWYFEDDTHPFQEELPF